MGDLYALKRLYEIVNSLDEPYRSTDAAVAHMLGWYKVGIGLFSGKWKGISPATGRRRLIPFYTSCSQEASTVLPYGWALTTEYRAVTTDYVITAKPLSLDDDTPVLTYISHNVAIGIVAAAVLARIVDKRSGVVDDSIHTFVVRSRTMRRFPLGDKRWVRT